MSAVTTAAVLAVFRVFAPEFAATSDDDVNAVISLCLDRVSSTAFGSRTSEALARVTAHELTLQARAANAASGGVSGSGAVTSLKAGDVAVTFQGVNQALSLNHEDAYYSQTSHGQAYLQIRDSRAYTGPLILT